MTESRDRWLAFAVRDVPVALPLDMVREVELWVPPRQGPAGPSGTVGTVTFHGTEWPVVDLGLRWDLGAAQPTPEACYVLLETPDREPVCAVYADRVAWSMAAEPRMFEPVEGLPFHETVRDGDDEYFVLDREVISFTPAGTMTEGA